MKEKVLETDEILKGSNSTTDAGEKGSICEEPKHKKLNLLVAELPTLVDSLTQDCRNYERSLRHERIKMGTMEMIWNSREREKKEVLKRNLELECELDAKKIRIAELTTKLEDNVDEIDGLQDLNQQLVTKERLGNNELQNARKALIEMPDDTDDDTDKGDFGLKRMGEIDHGAFLESCRLRYSPSEADTEAVKFCSEWQEKLQNPQGTHSKSSCFTVTIRKCWMRMIRNSKSLRRNGETKFTMQ
ncbi:factor of DNA methylation 5-like isoform X2 [Primulina huaijiensis]|uniref:factor of DNA methylation 5-like isoform X2 n=1 Tax=Primulina huaijiensis TaxID=1492673 RepID=UPI003CC737AE